MARSPLLTLREAADRLAQLGVGGSLAAVGAPPIARRGRKGEALYSAKALDAWAAALPRRGRVPIESSQARGEGQIETAPRQPPHVETLQGPWFAEPIPGKTDKAQ